ncbi:hypothetical protein ABH994_001483 [Bradyrhizobium yuanmingense]|uniref:hypothetical protein n=1 Tax=Bradyrhizobium yuanmingense TaxID=108015 RepID=UPI003512E67E
MRRLPSALPVVFDKRLRMSLRFQRMRVHTGSPIFLASEFAVRVSTSWQALCKRSKSLFCKHDENNRRVQFQ